MTVPNTLVGALTPHIAFDFRNDWNQFPSAGFAVTGGLIPPSANWADLLAQVWSDDFSALVLDNIAVTYDGTAGAWSIDNDFTGALASATNYQLLVKGMYGATKAGASQPFTKQ